MNSLQPIASSAFSQPNQHTIKPNNQDVQKIVSSSSPIAILYTDILTCVFDFLSVNALSKAMQTHRAWLTIIQNMRVQSQGDCVLQQGMDFPMLAISSLSRHIAELTVRSLKDSHSLLGLQHFPNLIKLTLASFHHTGDIHFITHCKFPQALLELEIREWYELFAGDQSHFTKHDLWANHMLREVSKLSSLQKFTWTSPLLCENMTPSYHPSIPWPCFDNLINLTTIDIFQQSLFEALPVARMASLTDLTLHEASAFEPNIVQQLAQQLKALKITLCHFDALQQIGQLSMLSSLDIGFDHSLYYCTDQDVQCLFVLQTWTGLKLEKFSLYLHSCDCDNFRFAIPFLLSQPNLSELSITAHDYKYQTQNICYGAYDIVHAFSHFKNLKKLKLAHPNSKPLRLAKIHSPHLKSYQSIMDHLSHIPQVVASLTELHLEKSPDMCHLVQCWGLTFPALTCLTTDSDNSNQVLKSFRLQSFKPKP